MFKLDKEQSCLIIVTLILVFICIILGIIAYFKEKLDKRLLEHPIWYSDRVKSTALVK